MAMTCQMREADYLINVLQSQSRFRNGYGCLTPIPLTVPSITKSNYDEIYARVDQSLHR
ncbi:hypothetical protein GGE65_004611 [Skermanella aerolata]